MGISDMELLLLPAWKSQSSERKHGLFLETLPDCWGVWGCALFQAMSEMPKRGFLDKTSLREALLTPSPSFL